MIPFIRAQSTLTTTVLGCETFLIGYNPSLNEAQGTITVIEFRMSHSRTGRHVLNGIPSERLVGIGRQTVLMSQFSVDNVRDNFHVSVRVCTKTTVRLHEIVIDDAQHTKIGIGGGMVFRKTEMEARLEPIVVGPGGILDWRIGFVAKPAGVRFRDV